LPLTSRLQARLLRFWPVLKRSKPAWKRIVSIGQPLKRFVNCRTSVQQRVANVFCEALRVNLTRTPFSDIKSLSMG
jgi:hypothetical protein